MFMNKEKKIARKITKLLNMKGFIIKQHSSKTSKSIYLKVDNGAVPVIRISDHKRLNNDNCKYNVIKNYYGPRSEIVKGKQKKYYNYDNIWRLVTDIELERNRKILTIGYSKYKNILNGKSSNNYYETSKAA